MTSYHDLEEQVYKGIRSNPFTRIHGTDNWRKKEIFNTEASYVVLECKLSHDWAGGIGLMVAIIGAMRYTSENPNLQLYVVPTQPLSSPLLPANPKAAQIRTLTDEKNLLKIDWDVMRGFHRGVSENIHDAQDLELFESLQHARCNYLKVLP